MKYSPIHFHVVHDLDTAKEVWNLLSPQKTLDDLWDFRYGFVKYLNYNPYFVTGFVNDKLIGVLPLQYNAAYGLMPPYAPKVSGFLEFFGGDDMDDNKILIKPGFDHYIPEFIEQIERRAILAPLSTEYAHILPVNLYTNKYILPLSNYNDYEDFFMDRFDSKKRSSLRRQIRKIYENHKVAISTGNSDDLEMLFELSIKRFGNDSSFRYEYRQQIFRDYAKMFENVVLTIRIDGNIEAVSFGIIHNGVYSDMNAVANHEVENLGKFLTFVQINEAIKRNCHTFDAGKGDSGWKESFHFDKLPQYILPQIG